MEVRWPVSLLKSMDLPTLGRPTIATKGFAMFITPYPVSESLLDYYGTFSSQNQPKKPLFTKQ
jgi:hypothetical protein